MGDIAGQIADVPGQTNILALNAAVEAARAGEHGRGFAVVASEVRALAQRCGAASRDIRKLVESSSAEVAQGGRDVGGARQRMDSIVADVEQVAQLVTGIAAANHEQASAIASVDGAMASIDGGVQHNAALGEAASAAARRPEQPAL